VSIADFAPDLAAEFLSPGNTAAEMARKRRELFAAGTRLVWEFSADRKTAEVFADPARPDARTRLTASDTLDGGAVLPEFRLPLAEVFAGFRRPQRPGADQ
jgi:Uma2 family endonuclease